MAPDQPQHEQEQGWWNCPWCGETTHVVCAVCSCKNIDSGAPADKCQPGKTPGNPVSKSQRKPGTRPFYAYCEDYWDDDIADLTRNGKD